MQDIGKLLFDRRPGKSIFFYTLAGIKEKDTDTLHSFIAAHANTAGQQLFSVTERQADESSPRRTVPRENVLQALEDDVACGTPTPTRPS